MTKNEIELLLERAAEIGSERALQRVGLSDKNAVHDVRELRGLLDSWRTAKKTAFMTIIKMMTAAFLGALVVGSWFEFNKR